MFQRHDVLRASGKQSQGKVCRPTAQNVVFRSLVLSFIPNALLFDLTAVASSYYFDLGLELNSLGRQHVRKRIRSHDENRTARPLSRCFGDDDSPNPKTKALARLCARKAYQTNFA